MMKTMYDITGVKLLPSINQEYYNGCKEIEISETYALKGGYLAEEILEALSY